MAEDKKLFKGFSRRDLLKSLGGIPILGAVWFAGIDQNKKAKLERDFLLEKLNIKATPPPESGPMSGDPLRIGLIGFGIRGEQLMRSLGFATNEWLEEMASSAANNPNDKRLADFKSQESLNVKLSAICDIFDIRAEKALRSFNVNGNTCKRFDNYLELIHSGEVDAVIIATPDHWHAPMAKAAIEAGIHVYLEKPMTHTVQETYELREACRKNPKAVFAVGHQHRQTQSFLTAMDALAKNTLGHVSLIMTTTNRNDDNGAWQYEIHSEASPETIDWNAFLGTAPQVPFNTEHFFRWRKWWAYGSGLSGDLLTHDYDRINCILKMGIPKYVTASGGIYTHRDGRNVPDVMHVNMEFPEFTTGGTQREGKEKGMTLVYSATLGNQFERGTVLMGHDASMELGNTLTIYADPRSTKYKDLIQEGRIDPTVPIFQYDPSASGVDAVTSATAKYFADKGLLWTYRDGKRVDSTFLHIREWLSCIRNGGEPSCGVQEGFEEAIAAHMAGLSYKIGRKVEWDEEKEIIIALPGEDLDAILLDNDYGLPIQKA
ncbi:Gfo/Idh/MocA family protein [Cecembia lonarensis]|uniref:Putative oxidoreductase ydgJ n=1 Tax=Cecembia lonarensis (strain CCUG 58316 / KCTC 22772 / LW9) TaxID=1225176 RepID=K1M4I2_CECL9|nr:Gfo/Idh/MocA family oxidoreductase [Cecembia lonarensis]EKB51154.1 putative oxidoreductase ydgJ [Cecembia lonarensis LW9]